MKKSEVLDKLAAVGFYPDSLTFHRQNGTWTAKRNYFYRLGQTVEHYAELVKLAGFEILVLDDCMRFGLQASFFQIDFK